VENVQKSRRVELNMKKNSEVDDVFNRLKNPIRTIHTNTMIVGVVIKTYPEMWKEIEASIHEYFPTAYIACVRKYNEGENVLITTKKEIKSLIEEEGGSLDKQD
jgi:hypothetical protein